MMRRAIPWACFACALLVGVLLVNDAVKAARPKNRVPNVLGHWDGFSLDASETVGRVVSDITRQAGRSVGGNAHLLDPSGAQVATFTFGGTLRADDVLIATGHASSRRVAFQGNLQFFSGSRGNAGVMDAQIHIATRKGAPVQLAALLIHPFPDTDAPDISGDGTGLFHSQTDGTFSGALSLRIDAAERNTFPGVVSFTPDSPLHAAFSWQSRTTVNDQGRLIVVAQGKTGRMVVDGSVLPGVPGATWRNVDGLYSLYLNDGRKDFGFYNFSLVKANP